jgi:uncharacterized protein YgiM (DUF1202 family)
MWIAIPVLVVVVVVAFWWALFADTDKGSTSPTPTPTMKVIRPATTVATVDATADAQVATPTLEVLVTPVLPTATAAPQATETPAASPTEATSSDGLAIGVSAKVVGTGGVGLNVRAGAGTGHARIKTLAEGSVVEVIGGPTDANGFTWWQMRDEAGATGWAASKFLQKQ